MNDATNNQPTAAAENGQPTNPSTFNPSNDPFWLRKEIRDRAIPVRSDATPAEVIPWVHKFIARYKQIGELIPINVESRKAWQALMDDALEFLKKLEAAAKIRPTIPNQPLPTRPKPGQTRPEPATPLPNPGLPLPEPVQPAPIPANSTPAVTTASSPPSIQSIESIPSIDSIPPQVPNPQSAIPAPKSDAEPSRDKLEFEDMCDEFANERERLAVARSELQDHLAARPVRLNKLTPQQQAAVFALMEESKFSSRAVAKILADPPPNGMSIRVSKTTVNDWRRQYKQRMAREANERKAAAELQAALEIVDKSTDADAAFQQAAERIVKLRILTSHDAPLDQFDQLVSTFAKLRKQSLAERKQLHAEKTNSA
jgi:hypothetical protein